MKKINIFGSTGTIGKKNLQLIKKYFPEIRVNLLFANKNYKDLLKQVNLYNPKYICIKDASKNIFLKNELKKYKKTTIIHHEDLIDFLKETKTDMSVLSISGNSALNYLEPIMINTNFLGIVNKECIVSAGHFLKLLSKKYSTKLFAIDSEHYSLQNYFDKLKSQKFNNIKKIYLTASGGPFLNLKSNKFKDITYENAIKHPKWKMGIKNSIDSATLVNKCLEIIEAHYLFDINFKKLDILIHPEALVHSVVEYKNFTSILNYFYHDMQIPIFNFLNHESNNSNFNLNKNFDFQKNLNLNFVKPDVKKFPILSIFNKMDKSDHLNILKFNYANELAVNYFASKKIKFSEIYNIIKKSLDFNINFEVNSVYNILKYQEIIINKIKKDMI